MNGSKRVKPKKTGGFEMQNALTSEIVSGISKHEIVGQVYITTDYSVFKLRPDNRVVKDNIKLRESVKRVGILAPVIVNEKFEIIDGQGRFIYGRKIKIPIPYIVQRGYEKTEIIELNTSANKWDLVDFIKTHADDGIEEYERLQDLVNNYSIVAPGILCILGQNKTDTNRPLDDVRSGQFKFVNYEFLVLFLDFYKELMEKTTIPNTGALVKALYTLYKLEKFDVDRIFDKSAKIAKELQGINQQGVAQQALLKCYNERLRDSKNNAIKYHINSRGNVVFMEENIKHDIA
jgi:hypothetical protein